MSDSLPEIEITLNGGDSLLTACDLWLDPHRAREFSFISHAHADHVAPHRRILCSTATRRLIEARFGSAAKADFLSLDFGETHTTGAGYRIELLPAGHIPGSAMLFVERLDDGATLLHTGDFKTRPAVGAENNEPRRADTLIMETTFGLPKFCFPPTADVIAAMTKFAREAIEDGEVPIFMAYSLGKAQEILLSLHEAAPELKFQVHDSVAKMNRIVETLGYALPPAEIFSPKERSPHGHVGIMPPSAGRSLAVRRLRKSVRLAMVSGWGMDPGAKYRYQCDEVFPLSDHAGYDDLLAFVDELKPQRVYTIHGYCAEFAADLRRRGIEAWPLAGETQRELEWGDSIGSGGATDPVESDGTPRPESPFAAFTAVAEAVAGVTGKLKKQEILADYLRMLEPDSLALAVRFFSGAPLRRGTVNLGPALIRQAILDLTGWSLVRYRQVSSMQADTARTVWLVLQGQTSPQPHTLAEMDTLFETLAAESSQTGKVRLLREALAGFHHSEAALVVGILLGDLRIGLKIGLLEEAIALAFGQKADEVREAHMLLGDAGETALLAQQGDLGRAGASWFTPVRVMLASPEETAEDIVTRHGGEGRSIWLEDKFDGIRAQLHRRGDEVGIYSRDLRRLDETFPELIEAARGLDHDVILDGEIIASAEGKRLTFFDLQKRLGRRDLRLDQGDLFFGEAIPVRFIAFDLLGVNGEGWLDRPLVERRAKLETLRFPGAMRRCEVYYAITAEDVDEAFNAAKRRDNEGLIAKDPGSLYSPGRRGKQWLKLKNAMPTLDVVVVKAQQGHGKRSHVLSDYTFAVRDEESGALRVIGKAYSGLTDLEIEEMTTVFRESTIEKNRGIHVVTPAVVLEIAFDSINASKRHDSGLALRFPRIKAIRRDKTAAEIDTLSYARKLAGLS